MHLQTKSRRSAASCAAGSAGVAENQVPSAAHRISLCPRSAHCLAPPGCLPQRTAAGLACLAIMLSVPLSCSMHLVAQYLNGFQVKQPKAR